MKNRMYNETERPAINEMVTLEDAEHLNTELGVEFIINDGEIVGIEY